MTLFFYASFQTKPGVIRPMTAIPRLTVEGEEEFYKNPFRQTLADFSKVSLYFFGLE